jgi:hypothetical protein
MYFSQILLCFAFKFKTYCSSLGHYIIIPEQKSEVLYETG